MKSCFKCGESKDSSQFANNPSKKDGLQDQCRDCQRVYRRQHYLKNKAKYIKKAAIIKADFINWFDSLRATLVCSECSEPRWWVLEFHHRDPSKKDRAISELRSIGNKSRLLKELDKCDVLCANCHRDLHYRERAGNA